MGSRIKSLFLGNNGRNSTSELTNESNPHLQGYSYDTAIALDPPLRGSYPVAGNGPKALDEVRRARDKRNSYTSSINGSAAAPPDISRRRDGASARPQTAPGDGLFDDAEDTRGRTSSMRSRQTSIFSPSPSRRDSSQSVSTGPSPFPKPVREVQTYRPTTSVITPEGFTPPYAAQNRTSSYSSHVSRKSYVDLLDAQSNIVQSSQEQSRHRTKASGHRVYGEDVADRNISNHGERVERESRLDLSTPELSYLKSIYPHKQGDVAGVEGSPSRAASAPGHVLGDNTRNDDTTTRTSTSRRPQTHTRATSVLSTGSQTRPAIASPPGRDSASARSYSTHDDGSAKVDGTGAHDHRGRRHSPLSPAATPIHDESPARDPRRHSVGYSPHTVSSPARGRTPFRLKEPPPVSPLAPVTAPQAQFVSKQPSKTSTARKPVAGRQRTMSTASQSTTTISPRTNGTGSQNGSVNYSAFPNGTPGQIPTKEQSNVANKRDYIVKGASEPPSLEGIVDLTNTVDTIVTTKTLPAVTHEHVTPTRHEIIEEVITREYHTQDVYHRVLPVIETEILPTKHYIKSADDNSLIEIPESEVPGISISGRANGDWQVIKTQNACVDLPTALQWPPHQGAASAAGPPEDDGADGPIIGLARGEPRKDNRSRGNSLKALSSKGKSILEPILTSTKSYITKDGIPRTEYVWRHPPVFETADGNTAPVYIGTGSGAFSGVVLKDDEVNAEGREIGAALGKNGKSEEALLFRDCGYGFSGMLPGVQDKSPMADFGHGTVVMDGSDGGLGKSVGKVKVEGSLEEKALRRKPVQFDGEATKGPRKFSERRRSSAPTGDNMEDLQNGVKNMSVRN